MIALPSYIDPQPKKRGRGKPFEKKHGMENTITYHVWEGMIQRCTNPNHDAYKRYGARGITVCEKWRLFAGFFEDMGERQPGMSLDRIDNSKGYCKENCRWVPRRQQHWNKCTNRFVEIDGVVKTVIEWTENERCKVCKSTVYARIRRGMDPKEAITTPLKYKRRSALA